MIRRRTREISRRTVRNSDFYKVDRVKVTTDRPIFTYPTAVLHFTVTVGVLGAAFLEWRFGVPFSTWVTPGTPGGYAVQALFYTYFIVGFLTITTGDTEYREERKPRKDANPVHALGV